VGKSTLVNAIVARKSLARTSQTPGKTRACNVYRVDQDYYLVDLPGYGYARASKQVRKELQALLAAYLRHRQELIGVVWLLDLRREPSVDDLSMGELLAARGVPVLATLTKADKIPRGRQLDQLRTIAQAVGISEDQCILTSAIKRDGIDELREAVTAAVTQGRLPS
jgi:GTP-binding protein